MSKKAILQGGKRDEIIYAAMELFFEKGYDETSVRMILDKVGGEVGMFYHYFKSKNDLFQTVVEYFFKDYHNHFIRIIESCDSKVKFIEIFLEYYEASMAKFNKLSPNMHWTIQYSMAARTIDELKPSVMSLIEKWGYLRKAPLDIIAGQVVYGISATLHTESFYTMPTSEKKQVLEDLINRLI